MNYLPTVSIYIEWIQLWLWRETAKGENGRVLLPLGSFSTFFRAACGKTARIVKQNTQTSPRLPRIICPIKRFSSNVLLRKKKILEALKQLKTNLPVYNRACVFFFEFINKKQTGKIEHADIEKCFPFLSGPRKKLTFSTSGEQIPWTKSGQKTLHVATNEFTWMYAQLMTVSL